jgi:hypothetical protein
LRFRIAGGQIAFASVEQLDTVKPSQVSDSSRAGTHGGQWIELRDSHDQVVSQRVLDPAEHYSVEVHSPDRTLERFFNELRDGIFEVLLTPASARPALRADEVSLMNGA